MSQFTAEVGENTGFVGAMRAEHLLGRCSVGPVLAIALAACAADPDARGASVRDSAGVKIILQTRPKLTSARAWRIEPHPGLSIGVVQGDPSYQFHNLTGATRLADGRIVIADLGTNELRFFDSNGRFLETVGGQGDGPGEFETLGALFRIAGDTLLVTDLGRDRISVFTASGDFVRSFNLPLLAGRMPRLRSIFLDGSQVLRVSVRGRQVPATRAARDTFLVAIRHPASNRVDTIGRLPGFEEFLQLAPTGGIAQWAMPFSRNLYTAISTSALYVAVSDANEIRAYDRTGRLATLIRRNWAPPKITSGAISRFKQHSLASAENEAQRARREQVYSIMTFPEAMPAFADVRIDAADHLWIREYAPPWSQVAQLWSVSDPDGTWLATVQIPFALRVFEIGADYVLGAWSDESNVEFVRLYRLIKPES